MNPFSTTRWTSVVTALLASSALLILFIGQSWSQGASDRRRTTKHSELETVLQRELSQAALDLRQWMAETRSRDFTSVLPFAEVVAVHFDPPPPSVGAGSATFAKAERLEFVEGDRKRASSAYRRLLDSGRLTPDERAEALRRLGVLSEESDPQATRQLLHQALLVPGASSSVLWRVECDLAERDAESKQRFLDKIRTGEFETILPGQRAHVYDRLGGEPDSIRGLIALGTLDDAGASESAVLVSFSNGENLAWDLPAEKGTAEVVFLVLDEALRRLLPGFERGRWEVAGEGVEAEAPFPAFSLGLGDRAREEIDEAAHAAWLGRFIPSIMVAIVLGVASALFWVTMRRQGVIDQRKDNFIATVTHELKTPIANIVLYAETLREHGGQDPSSVPRFARTILDEAERLMMRIQQVLDVAAGRTEFSTETTTFDPTDILHAIVADYRPGAEDVGVRLELTVPDRCAKIRGSIEIFAQAISGLIDNAIKFSKPGAVAVQLIERKGHVIVTVDDEGPGIPVAERERIFEPFVRLGSEMTRSEPGTGLGLTLVRQCVETFKGRLRVGESPSGGARFSVMIRASEDRGD